MVSLGLNTLHVEGLSVIEEGKEGLHLKVMKAIDDDVRLEQHGVMH